MEKNVFGPEYGFATRAVHTGNDIDQDSGAIKRPITMANSYALPYDPTDVNCPARPEIYIRETEEPTRSICKRGSHLLREERTV